MTNTRRLRQERDAIVGWAANDNYTHAITLNTDRELSLARLKDIFSTFCHAFDKRVHHIRNMRNLPTHLRLRAIVFPENLETNAHLHGVADFVPALAVLKSEWRLQQELRLAWHAATRGAGSVHLEEEPDAGWLTYSTKRFNGEYLHAFDFHPH